MTTHAYVTYNIVGAANGAGMEGTYERELDPVDLTHRGKRVGNTVLYLTRLADIISPGPAARAVFIDGDCQGSGFLIPYLEPRWSGPSPPPIRHAGGATLSMADRHAGYWKWKSWETVSGLPRKLSVASSGITFERIEGGDYEPKTEDGLYDLQRTQRAVWGRLGYSAEEKP